MFTVWSCIYFWPCIFESFSDLCWLMLFRCQVIPQPPHWWAQAQVSPGMHRWCQSQCFKRHCCQEGWGWDWRIDWFASAFFQCIFPYEDSRCLPTSPPWTQACQQDPQAFQPEQGRWSVLLLSFCSQSSFYLFSIDVRKYVIKRTIKKEGKKDKVRSPKIQRLVTPQRLQRKRAEFVINWLTFGWNLSISSRLGRPPSRLAGPRARKRLACTQSCLLHARQRLRRPVLKLTLVADPLPFASLRLRHNLLFVQ